MKGVDLAIFTEHQLIKIDGEPYEIYNQGELSAVTAAAINAAWKKAGAMEAEKVEPLDGEDDDAYLARVKQHEQDYLKLVRRLVGLIMVDLPAEVRAKVTVQNAADICKVFFGLPQAAPTTGVKAKKAPWRPPTTGKSRRG
jgi:hypothetical protein